VDLRGAHRHRDGSGRLLGVPEGTPAPFAPVGRETLHRYPVLERTRQGWPLRRFRATCPVHRGGQDLLPPRPVSIAAARHCLAFPSSTRLRSHPDADAPREELWSLAR